jgi:hypothetical protein
MRKIISLFFLAVFAMYFSIAVFHPLTHAFLEQHEQGHPDNECSICLWLSAAAIIIVAPVIFLPVQLKLISFIAACCVIFRVKDFFYCQFSHAPPKIVI